MHSRLADAIALKSSPVAVLLTDDKPDSATQFKEGRMGCVAAMLLAAAKGRIAVFDRKTFGCPGGGTGVHAPADDPEYTRFLQDYALKQRTSSDIRTEAMIAIRALLGT